ncbi:YdcF family protein [Murimonas intestini]|uniref:YdcF family protein n=1 Tax=Murimonas intestini TaxID=1337051 RepID=UPI0011DD2ED0|nr:YdcF family protein [Murimonas intestini]
MRERIAECINILGEFCGKRDLPVLTREELKNRYGVAQADIMVLFGGSIMCGGDVLAEAIRNKIARKYIIVGGEGHTTETLRIKMHSQFPCIETAGLSEACIFDAYLRYRYGLAADFLECESTNCGNNITYLLELLKRNGLDFKTIILAQDASMQRRMEAGLRKYVSKDVTVINFAVYSAKVVTDGPRLVFENEIWGMWDMDRYITLLMGEIPRLSDSKDGYGPNGKNFIAHVDIPEEVVKAFSELQQEYPDKVREANPLFESKIQGQDNPPPSA